MQGLWEIPPPDTEDTAEVDLWSKSFNMIKVTRNHFK